MRNKLLVFLAILVLFELPLISIGQVPSYNTYKWLPPGTDVHPLDSDPFDDGWILDFEEHFSVNASYPNFSTYETDKWVIKTGPTEDGLNTNDDFLFRKQNVFMQNGYCFLVSKKEPVDIYWPPNQQNYKYSSGGIQTKNVNGSRHEWETGMFEVRMRHSAAYWGHDNMWIFNPGRPVNQVNTESGEIDACEMDPGLKMKVPHHFHANHGGTTSSVNANTPLPVSAAALFHVYTVIWDKYFIRIYINHIPVVTLSKLHQNNGFDVIGNVQLMPGTLCKLVDAFMPINMAGIVILDQYIWDKDDKAANWFEKNFVPQTAGMPGTTVIDWFKVYKRNPCSQVHKITASKLFPYNNLDEQLLFLGDNAIGNSQNEPWQTVAPHWGHGQYTAEGITLVDNFDFHPVESDAYLNDPTAGNQQYTSFEFIPKNCSELRGVNEYELPQHKELNPEEDPTEPVADTFNCYEYLDYDAIDNAIDSAIVTNDSVFLIQIYAFLDSLGCPHEMEDSNSNFSARMARVEEEIGKNDPETLAAISRLRVYPNPNNGSFLIATNGKGKYDIQVVNILGVVVYNGSLTDEQRKSIKLDDALPPGTYTIHINGPGIKHVEKLTIIK